VLGGRPLSWPPGWPSEPGVRRSEPGVRPSEPSCRGSEPGVRRSEPGVRRSEPADRPSEPCDRSFGAVPSLFGWGCAGDRSTSSSVRQLVRLTDDEALGLFGRPDRIDIRPRRRSATRIPQDPLANL